jgi:hypothetical protein
VLCLATCTEGQQGRVSRRLAGLAALTLLVGGTTACGDDAADPRPSDGASAIGTATTSPSATTEDASPVDTYADVEPAPQALDASLVDGVEAFGIWADAEAEETPQQLGGGTRTDDGEAVAVALSSREGLLAMKNARAEIRYLDRHSGLATGPLEMLDPVVVDGLEMARARGASINGLDVDFFIHATGERTIELDFLTPASLGEAEREEWIGQVMATLEISAR